MEFTSNRAVFEKVKNIRVFKRNVDECILCCNFNINPADRPRYNGAESPSPTRPTSKDIGLILEDLAITFKKASENFEKMGTLLQREDLLTYDFENSRRIVQNNFDTIRYLAPMFKNFSSLALAVNDPDGLVMLASNN